uniref:Mannan endo-1,4-beta-mannosidase B n=1 Tax=Paenibacillus mucilaginosus K02 TaxID=997761 RepID=V9IRA3_9BACL|nr:mannan endo-1,4-beta-mannosidase B precursor [Paenibacillus mucilaginosus K02]
MIKQERGMVTKRRMVIGWVAVNLLAGVPLAAAAAGTGKATSVIYEAEDGLLAGTTVGTASPGYSGSGYVTSFDDAADSLTFTVNVPVKGLYEIRLGYNGPYGDKRTTLAVNGQPAGEIALASTTGFKEIPATKALLNAGSNTIRIDRGWGWFEIDYLKVGPAPVPAPHQITKALVDPQVTPEAKSLMSFLVDTYGSKMLAGQQGYNNVSWLETNVGKKPALVGFDFIEYSPSRVEHGSTSTETEKAIDWDRQGGVVTFAWHWNAPKGLIDQPGKEWWRGFYTDSTTFDIEYAMSHPESEDYKLLLRDIDAIAVQLKKLQDAKVPVLFRPLHEAEGGWFWWGAKGPEPCKALYRLLYERLTGVHNIHNLIWVWNSISPQWYPGDDVVDVVSFDSYPAAGDYSPQVSQYDQLVALSQNRKLIAMTENGSIPDPDLMDIYHTDWSWFCTWEGSFLTDGNTNTLAHLKKVYQHANVLTLDELPNLKTYGGGGVVTAPAAPSGLAAAAGDKQAVLSWTASAGAASYTVKRSAASGGPYTTVAAGITGTSYTDTGLTGGTTYYYVVTAANSAGESANSAQVSAVPTSGPAAPAGTLKVQYRAGNTNPADNTIAAHFNIKNTGTTAVKLSDLKLRYYFTKDGSQALQSWVDWAQIGSANVNRTFGTASGTGADTYVELSFTDAAGSIPAGGQSGDIQLRIAKSDWSNFSETGDYSFDGTKTAYGDWNKVTLHLNGSVVWGSAPN